MPCLDNNELKSRIDKVYSEFKNQKRSLRSSMLGHKVLINKAPLQDLKQNTLNTQPQTQRIDVNHE